MTERKTKPATHRTGNDSGRSQSPPAAANPLRQIPSVEETLNRPAIRALAAKVGRKFVADRVRQVLAALRDQIQRADIPSGELDAHINLSVGAAVERELAFSLRPVINATGVILHTNLGRAPLARESLDHLIEIATQYSNLEFDIAGGRRGERDVHVSRHLQDLLGAPGIAVNNNAAAVLITLNTLAEGGEVVVSRGELIEIGGSFRIPDIMRKSGAVLREVGTTNRTRISDYEAAINENTKLLLRVHPSNFRIVGFTERPTLEEMVALSKKTGIPVYEDLGSGCLVPSRLLGSLDEAPVADSLSAGVNVVSFSGDKLLGGPQAGLIAGKKDLVARIRRNPLFRVLRADKMTYAVLETTLQTYRQEQFERIPAWRMIQMTTAEIEGRALRLMEACALPEGGPMRLELVNGESVIGGGSAPGQTIPTRLIALRHRKSSASAITGRLLAQNPPVVARAESDRVLVDLRTVLPEQDPLVVEAIRALSRKDRN
ncbi:MAG: L-seryl-tRNA(Sec) selenium transferase [Acidobacteria bacterium]|nr:L-seryl-tRNA(Sec) selenium transferase [Acidobacteriota bacterium]